MDMPAFSTSVRSIPTDEELMSLPEDGYKRELLDGEIVMSPAAGFEHGMLISRFTRRLGTFIDEHKLGELFDGQTGFRMRNLDVLCPDISFVSRERLAKLVEPPRTFFEGSPDLAVEFLSPGESMKRMRRKLEHYFASGTKLAWIMNSRKKIVTVHHGVEPAAVLQEADELTGGEVLSGFKLPVRTIFAGI